VTVGYRKLFLNLYSSIDTIRMMEMKEASDTQEKRKNMRIGDYLGDLSLERKILHWIMYKLHGRVWNGFLFIWTTGGFL